ncbi:hypothetical protein GCM10008915_31130 [Bifidobacterium pullorum subsp. gallinarum]
MQVEGRESVDGAAVTVGCVRYAADEVAGGSADAADHRCVARMMMRLSSRSVVANR